MQLLTGPSQRSPPPVYDILVLRYQDSVPSFKSGIFNPLNCSAGVKLVSVMSQKSNHTNLLSIRYHAQMSNEPKFDI